jgi:trehalose-phosphatase
MTPALTTGESAGREQRSVIPMTRLAGRPLLLMLDVDGTLAPIVRDPALARVPDETRRAIATLASRPDIIVALVSGRSARDARRVVGVDGVWAVGNHGAEVLSAFGEITVDPDVPRYAAAIADAARSLVPVVGEISGAVVENKTWTLSVHYRNADPASIPRLRSAVEAIATRHELRMTDGKKIFEIRPPVRVDKGTAVARLADQLGAHGPDASLLFAGDDVTDEDAFRLLRAEYPHAVTIHVGDDAETSAEFTISTVDDMRAVLDRIVASTAIASR